MLTKTSTLKRYMIEDEMLSDPNYNYTTKDICRRICGDEESMLRMIQKDIKALKEDFGMEMEKNAGGRGTIRYADQSKRLFYQPLSVDEEKVLREAIRTLGQFSGLDNFTWLERLRKKLDMDGISETANPIISFSKNEDLKIPSNLLARLFTAISRKDVIRVSYQSFKQNAPKDYDVYPYQLKQFNDRWFLLATPIGDDAHEYDPDFMFNLALDRIIDFTCIGGKEDYVETPLDLKYMYDEIVGVTLDKRYPDPEDIYFAMEPNRANYVRTKPVHATQLELDEDSVAGIAEKYPSLAGWPMFSICCRYNSELLARLLSFGDDLVVFDMPDDLAEGVRSTAARKTYESAKALVERYEKLHADQSLLESPSAEE